MSVDEHRKQVLLKTAASLLWLPLFLLAATLIVNDGPYLGWDQDTFTVFDYFLPLVALTGISFCLGVDVRDEFGRGLKALLGFIVLQVVLSFVFVDIGLFEALIPALLVLCVLEFASIYFLSGCPPNTSIGDRPNVKAVFVVLLMVFSYLACLSGEMVSHRLVGNAHPATMVVTNSGFAIGYERRARATGRSRLYSFIQLGGVSSTVAGARPFCGLETNAIALVEQVNHFGMYSSEGTLIRFANDTKRNMLVDGLFSSPLASPDGKQLICNWQRTHFMRREVQSTPLLVENGYRNYCELSLPRSGESEIEPLAWSKDNQVFILVKTRNSKYVAVAKEKWQFLEYGPEFKARERVSYVGSPEFGVFLFGVKSSTKADYHLEFANSEGRRTKFSFPEQWIPASCSSDGKWLSCVRKWAGKFQKKLRPRSVVQAERQIVEYAVVRMDSVQTNKDGYIMLDDSSVKRFGNESYRQVDLPKPFAPGPTIVWSESLSSFVYLTDLSKEQLAVCSYEPNSDTHNEIAKPPISL